MMSLDSPFILQPKAEVVILDYFKHLFVGPIQEKIYFKIEVVLNQVLTISIIKIKTTKDWKGTEIFFIL